jgi:hypothetical protein
LTARILAKKREAGKKENAETQRSQKLAQRNAKRRGEKGAGPADNVRELYTPLAA